MLASNGDPSLGLTIYNAAAPEYRLSIGLRGWIPGWFWRRLISFFVYRHFAGKVRLEDGSK
jgi:hypothetical protein